MGYVVDTKIKERNKNTACIIERKKHRKKEGTFYEKSFYEKSSS